jgi:hypothetical protein
MLPLEATLKNRVISAIFTPMSETAHDPKHLLDIIGQQNVAIEKLLAERDELRSLLEANGQKLDALTCLQRTYNNPKASETNRIKAALPLSDLNAPRCQCRFGSVLHS